MNIKRKTLFVIFAAFASVVSLAITSSQDVFAIRGTGDDLTKITLVRAISNCYKDGKVKQNGITLDDWNTNGWKAITDKGFDKQSVLLPTYWSGTPESVGNTADDGNTSCKEAVEGSPKGAVKGIGKPADFASAGYVLDTDKNSQISSDGTLEEGKKYTVKFKFGNESSSDAWVSNILNHITCKDASGNRSEVSDSFKSACTLTADELNAMGVDRNKNNPPSDFLIYDMTVQPGTKGTLSNNTFINPNNGSSYAWVTRASDGAKVLYKDGKLDADEFVSDGTYTYYVNSDGTIMKNEFAWHPTENHPIYFDENGHEVFNDFKGVGDYTYFFQADGSPMTDRLTYHPDGEHIIYFDGNGHEVFSSFAHPSMTITGETIADGDQYYFNVYGYMYKNTVTYDATGTKLYYINGNGQMQHSGWFTFEDNAGYGDDPSAIWQLTGSRLGFAQYDGSLLTNASTFDYNGAPVYMQGNGEAAY